MRCKFTFTLTINNNYPEKVILEKRYSEGIAHIALKVLAFILFRKESPKIEKRISHHYKPDLVKEGEGSLPSLWIDCGKIAIRKLDKLATSAGLKTKLFVVKKDERSLKSYKLRADKRLKHPERVHYVGFSEGFIDGLVKNMNMRKNELRCIIKKDTLKAEINGNNLETKIIYL